MPAPFRLPPTRSPAVERLVDVAQDAASQAGYALVLERSDRSEACYLHVQRESVWYGLRVACHTPHYECSADYHQLLVPFDATADILQRSMTYTREAVMRGGRVVADPHEVAEAIEQAERAQVDGFLAADSAGNRWRWSATQRRWWPEARVSSRSSQGPQFIPHARLGAQARCAIRHRLNHRAHWSFDERQRQAKL